MATIDPRVDIGHVHLKVADIGRALDFYCGVLGFELQHRYGEDAAFVSAGGYHHHLGLNTWESRGGGPPPPHTTGLYHAAIRYPDRRTLADACTDQQAARAVDVWVHSAAKGIAAMAASLKPSDENVRRFPASAR